VVDFPARVEFQDISKQYPGVRALDRVSFAVAPGRIHALVGENGAGKSTLMKILAGATPSDGGTIRLDGEAASIRDAHSARRLGIAMVFQEFSLAPDLSVAENVFLGRWPCRGPGLVSFSALQARSTALFDSLGAKLDVRRRVGELSVAQQQLVEIARALSVEARLLVLDEPSAVLTPDDLAALFASVRELARRGVGVIYISHRLDEIFALCQDVTVLRDGRHVSTRPVSQADRSMLIREMVGRPIEEEFPRRNCPLGEVVLRVDRLTAAGRFRNVSFDLRKGELLALTGLVGSGRSSLGRTLFGALPAGGGTVRVDGKSGPFPSPRRAQRAGVAYLPEDRKQQGLLLDRALYENVTLAHLGDVSTWGVLRTRAERRTANEKLLELRIKAVHVGVPAKTLSGGNQQKVMVARWLQRPYRVIILDEPTRGVDVGAKIEMYGLINQMAAGGAGVLMITSELPEAIGMADRIAVMCKGELAGILDNRDRSVTQEAILRLAVGGAGAG
jgi:ABC-type sugar transport system ATPase subunit